MIPISHYVLSCETNISCLNIARLYLFTLAKFVMLNMYVKRGQYVKPFQCPTYRIKEDKNHNSGALACRRWASGAPYLRKFVTHQSKKNLVTHQSKKMWLSRDCPYDHTPISWQIRVAPLPWLHLWFWVSVLWLIDSCQNKLCTD